MTTIAFDGTTLAADCCYQANDQYADKQCMNCAHKKPTEGAE